MLGGRAGMAHYRLFRASSRQVSTASLMKLGEMLTSDEARQGVTRLRLTLAEIAKLKLQYGAEPAPIDFTYYKSKLDPSIVATFEESYAALKFPTKATVPPDPADAAHTNDQLAAADALIKESEDRIAELQKTIAMMEEKKTGPTTTIADVFAQYPELEAEVDEEIDKHEWYKDAI